MRTCQWLSCRRGGAGLGGAETSRRMGWGPHSEQGSVLRAENRWQTSPSIWMSSSFLLLHSRIHSRDFKAHRSSWRQASRACAPTYFPPAVRISHFLNRSLLPSASVVLFLRAMGLWRDHLPSYLWAVMVWSLSLVL